MATWPNINSRIVACRQSHDPIGCLEALFSATQDGHVAMSLGELYQRKGNVTLARQWYESAEARYPLASYKARAREASARLAGAADARDPDVQPRATTVQRPCSVLHIVSCSRTKAWEDPTVTERFLPARLAYQGAEMNQWLSRPDSAQSRWLILSAKYGFIEPDHPISDYDVTFNEPSTGPIVPEALRAQVLGQTRWSDRVPLKDFTEVLVHGGQQYLRACEVAFRGVARVKSAGGVDWSKPPAPAPLPTFEPERAAALAAMLVRIPAPVYAALDRQEPEWPVIERLARAPQLGISAALALALSNYQLSDGGASAYWHEAEDLLRAHGVPSTDRDVLRLMQRLVETPVAAGHAEQRLGRIWKLMQSDLPSHFGQLPIEAVGERLDEIWARLAAALNQHKGAKTIVFAIKILDLLHCCLTGRYTDVGLRAPIVADLRIARVTFSSGLLRPVGDVSAADAMAVAEAVMNKHPTPFVRGWDVVRDRGRLNMLRLDSLLWQVAEPIYRHRYAAPDGRRQVEMRLVLAGATRPLAEAVAQELTFALR